MRLTKGKLLWLTGLLLALLAAYSNHFGNGFHFDDFHTVQYNPAIRSLANIPLFFRDATTFSLKAAGYRPLVTTSLAVDYALGGGLKPCWFHASTFVWFLTQLVLLYMLSLTVFGRARPDPRNWWLAWLVAAVYGLHPVSAETVNYVVQRGDLYAALGIVAGVVIYARAPGMRRYGLYLIPALAGMFAKPTALVFAPILLTYIVLVDGVPLISGIRRSLPAFALCGSFAYFEKLMTPAGFVPTTLSSFDYWITQPYVILRYFRSFFLPLYLSADTDLPAFDTLWDVRALAGLGFCGLLVAASWWTGRQREWRPVSFGLWWFLIGLIPTAVYPLAEVENDHRMFLPFVGLSLAVVWSAGLILRRRRRWELAAASAAVLVLAGFAWGTHSRNEVWRDEATLWRDVTIKSPGNARGLLNYGFALLTDGDPGEAYTAFQRATVIRPNYARLEENLGIAAGALCHDDEAERHFQTAKRLSPGDPWTLIDYAGWLYPRGRVDEARSAYQSAAELNPANLDASYGLMEVCSHQSDWTSLRMVTSQALRRAPGDPVALAYSTLAGSQAPPASPAQDMLNRALAACHSERYADCRNDARRSLALNPDFAEAYIQIAVAELSLGRWDEAIAASREALRLKPSFAFALKNLTWALSRRNCR